MTKEQRKTHAQYLNGIAVAVLTTTASAVIAQTIPGWPLLVAFAASAMLHALAARIARSAD